MQGQNIYYWLNEWIIQSRLNICALEEKNLLNLSVIGVFCKKDKQNNNQCFQYLCPHILLWNKRLTFQWELIIQIMQQINNQTIKTYFKYTLVEQQIYRIWRTILDNTWVTSFIQWVPSVEDHVVWALEWRIMSYLDYH